MRALAGQSARGLWMFDVESGLWPGWRLISLIAAVSGGSEARARARLEDKRRRQLQVLKMIAKSRGDLLRGARDVDITPEQVAEWMKAFSGDKGESVYEIRDQVNFLALGLEKGRLELGWKVDIPAPIRLIPREPSPFTPDSFKELNAYRDWRNGVVETLISRGLSALTGEGKYQSADQEKISWGLVLFLGMENDGLINAKCLYAMPNFCKTLTLGGDSVWLEFFGDTPEASESRTPPRLRWFLGPTTLAVLLRHLSIYGEPDCDSAFNAKIYSRQAWRFFCSAIGCKHFALATQSKRVEQSIRLSLPPYLVNALSGRLSSTSLPELRWQQLLLGGRAKSFEADQDQQLTEISDAYLPQITERDFPVRLDKSHELLKELQRGLYKPRDQLRPSFKQTTERLDAALIRAQKLAPVVEALCLWLISLHQRKRKPSTLYQYLNKIGFPLLCALGETPIDEAHAVQLADAYHEIAEQAPTEKSRHYLRGVLSVFNTFLHDHLGMPQIYLGERDAKAVRNQADANLLSEQEYDLVLDALRCFSATYIGKCCYWIFVLGYRSGLRISEALSIQLRDVQLSGILMEHSEFILIIRPNSYVDIKSHDSRRQLPLHLLLTSVERDGFEQFVRSRKELEPSPSAMLFSSSNSQAPLQDSQIHPVIHRAMRGTTGDGSLRYHHLRHTLANNLLLAYHGIQPPWKAPQHLQELMSSLGVSPSRTGLYFISQLMGHASPETTLKSYIHCLDFIAHHYLLNAPTSVGGQARRHEYGDAALLALPDILNTKEATIRKWKQRFGENPVRWMTMAFKNLELRALNKNLVGPYQKPEDIPLDPRRGIETLTLSELEQLFKFSRFRKPTDLERIFSLEPGSYAVLEKAYAYVTGLKTRKNSKTYRHVRPDVYVTSSTPVPGHYVPEIHLLPRPRSLYEREFVQGFFVRVQELFMLSESQERVLLQLRFFFANHRSRDGHVVLKDAAAGIAFMLWLCQISKKIRFHLHITPTLLSELTVEEQEQKWRTELHGFADRMVITRGKAGRRFRCDIGTAILKLDVSGGDKSDAVGVAVRYVLVVLCVWATALKLRHS